MLVEHAFQMIFASITLDVQKARFHVAFTAVVSLTGAYERFIGILSLDQIIPRKLTDSTNDESSAWPVMIIGMVSVLVGAMGLFGFMSLQTYDRCRWLFDCLRRMRRRRGTVLVHVGPIDEGIDLDQPRGSAPK